MSIAILTLSQFMAFLPGWAGDIKGELLLRSRIEPYELVVQHIEFSPAGEAAAHGHSGHEILYVLEGSTTIRTGETTRSLKAGEVFHVTPGTVMAVSNPSQASEARLLVFYLSER